MATLEGAMKYTTTYFNETAKRENDDGLEAIRKSGKTQITVLKAEQKHAFKKALFKVHAEMADKLGKPLLNSIYAETGMDPVKE